MYIPSFKRLFMLHQPLDYNSLSGYRLTVRTCDLTWRCYLANPIMYSIDCVYLFPVMNEKIFYVIVIVVVEMIWLILESSKDDDSRRSSTIENAITFTRSNANWEALSFPDDNSFLKIQSPKMPLTF